MPAGWHKTSDESEAIETQIFRDALNDMMKVFNTKLASSSVGIAPMVGTDHQHTSIIICSTAAEHDKVKRRAVVMKCTISLTDWLTDEQFEKLSGGMKLNEP